MPTRERYVWVCANRRPDGNPKGSCAQSGSDEVRDKLKAACNEAGLASRVRVMSSSCIDLCEHAVALVVMPENVALGGVTVADVPALVEALRAPGGVTQNPTLQAKVIPPGEALVSLRNKP